MTHYNRHQRNQLRNEKDEGENQQAHQGVRENFLADIFVNDAHREGIILVPIRLDCTRGFGGIEPA
jgi:hypothetical protein